MNEKAKKIAWGTVISLFLAAVGTYATLVSTGILPKPFNPVKSDVVARIERGETRNLPFGDYTWRILDVQEDRALLITEDIIEQRPYEDTKNIEKLEVTWETSTLRKYLNGEFYKKFSARDRKMIIETKNANMKNQWYATNGGNNTTDKIFLLSIEEAVKYFGDSGDVKAKKGWSSENEKYVLKEGWVGWLINDEYNRERKATFEGKTWYWWLRSPGASSDCASDVTGGGLLNMYGPAVNDEGGVRPALWVKL